MSSPTSMTMIKKDALINIQVGTAFLEKIQNVVVSIMSEKSEEEMKQFEELATQGVTDFPEQWMDNVVVLSMLMNEIQQQAIKQGHTYEKPVNTEGN